MVSRRTKRVNGKSQLKPESDKSGFRRKRLSSIRPSPENERLYRPIHTDDPAIIALADDIRKSGLREPIVITEDGYILSGHRRYVACRLAGLKTVPVRVKRIRRETCGRDRYLAELRKYNLQRDKSREEKLREELVSANPERAHAALINRRVRQYNVSGETIRLNGHKRRSAISNAKLGMLNAVIAILNRLGQHWPLSERTIHYNLLNDPPLRHTCKPQSRYRNDRRSSQDLSDLCTRARINGDIPFDAIADETRPVVTWNVHDDPRDFMLQELDEFLGNYWRNLMVSQPHHVENVCEKNTVFPILRPVASRYTIPITSGRGFSSLPPRKAMFDRYEESGKERLILIVVSDFDPSGESIAASFAQSMRDDFGIEDIHPVKAALTYEQVQRMDLHTDFTAKRSDSRYKKFVEQYGEDVYELEAVDPGTLQRLLTEMIDSVIDIEAFNAELDVEKEGAVFLERKRRKAFEALGEIAGDEDQAHG